MSTVLVLYPHQLFTPQVLVRDVSSVWLVEDPLFFTQVAFHKQKLLFHRATCHFYGEELRAAGFQVRVIRTEEIPRSSDIGNLLSNAGVTSVLFYELDDDWLERRVMRGVHESGISFHVHSHPLFLTPRSIIDSYQPKRGFFFFSDFYIAQRKRLHVLLSGGKPEGGKWSFDAENRERLPKDCAPPPLPKPSIRCDSFAKEIDGEFSGNPGRTQDFAYPVTRSEAHLALDDFIAHRLTFFGPYEDAIAQHHVHLFHSVLSPLLNVGLLDPQTVVNKIVAAKVPLNSREGCVRQILGWREFIRLAYIRIGRKQRTTNTLEKTRRMPQVFYEGTSGIEPVDTVIRRVVEHAYCHHIERLMVLGNFFLLCDVHPDDVYRWFMELFIDAYDWVMVPNVYGMSQFSDGGLMTTKPYVSGSGYILKMSDFKRGSWCEVWDALYWRFIDTHREMIARNPRMGVMAGMRDKLHANGKLKEHLRIANQFLARVQ